MNRKTQQLDELFLTWEADYGRSNRDTQKFTRDGIIKEDLWDKAQRKVLFLLKETNNWPVDLREEGFFKKPWKMLGYWAYGLFNATAHEYPSFDKAKENFESACRSSAIVNLKKFPGGGEANDREIREATKRDLRFIRRELEIIDPEIIVCGGLRTFDIARTEIHEFFSNLRGINESGRCFRRENLLVLIPYHPSARGKKHKDMYQHLMELHRRAAENAPGDSASEGR